MRNETIKLISRQADGKNVSENASTVFAEKKSVGRAEFYAAYAAGLNPKLIFSVDSLDYETAGDPVMVEYKGRRYNIVRAYDNGDEVELTIGMGK